MMNIVFRTDASITIGTGHVMRCLTLAQQLVNRGAAVQFVCRLHRGHLCDLIEQQGYRVHHLSVSPNIFNDKTSRHTRWLGVEFLQDALETSSVIKSLPAKVDWLVVDHYSLDYQWEKLQRHWVDRIFVIDDLADRPHDCDLLLDQNLALSQIERYDHLVSNSCRQLLGPHYALVRDEFSTLRRMSKNRRITSDLDNLLVFMGGSDPDNETGKVLEGIKLAKRKWKSIDIVVGASFPCIRQVLEIIKYIPQAILHIQTSRMAELVGNVDLAVTAGGTITWEKCTLGIPSLVTILSDNQFEIATAMHDVGAQITLGWRKELSPEDYAGHLDSIQSNDLKEISRIAQTICDGKGAWRVAEKMFERNG